jgi:anti-sigma regulatory factor (Ser/Thr protein kinase)
MNAASAENSVSISIGNTILEMIKVVDFVERFGSEHGIPQSITNDLNICLDELLNNTISYGYADTGPHEIVVNLSLLDGVLTAVLRDDGMLFDPNQSLPIRPSGDLKSRKIGGLGLHFVKSLMDEVVYRRVGHYNETQLKKKFR